MRRHWINLQAELLQRLPPTLQNGLSAARHLPSYLQWLVHPNGRPRLARTVGPLEGAFRGYRCIVIGNGPSLRQMDLARLNSEFTIGLNRIYLLTDELGFEPTFFAAINRYVLGQFSDEIREVKGLKFLNWSYRDNYLDLPDAVFLETRPSLSPSGTILNGYFAGAGTVTVFALQIAFFLGFSEVILIGVDHSYESKGTPNKAVMAEEADRSHFSKDYFGPGVVWQLPDLVAMERGYRQIRSLFEDDSRRIVDATAGGKLEVYPKVEFDAYLQESSFLSRGDYEG